MQTKCDKAEKVLKELSKAVSMVGDIDRDIGATLAPQHTHTLHRHHHHPSPQEGPPFTRPHA